MARTLVSLPPGVQAALAALVGSMRPRDVSKATKALSERYRQGGRSRGTDLIKTDDELRAYAVSRFPATFAAAVAAFEECARAAPGWRPVSVLDVGSGIGATALACIQVWPSLERVTCIERDARAVAAGSRVASEVLPRVAVNWVRTDMLDPLPDGEFDLVTSAYSMSELVEDAAVATARRLWARTRGLLILVEPGRPDAYALLMRIRDTLIGAGADVLAPCPHSERCPLLGSDWCHFGQRLPRTTLHRAAKAATLSYEDEKYSYVALSRGAATQHSPRVIRRPVRHKGLVTLELCTTNGVLRVPVPRSNATAYPAAKRVLWGQTFEWDE